MSVGLRFYFDKMPIYDVLLILHFVLVGVLALVWWAAPPTRK